MKLLVLAQTPPPLHGQSLMVQILVAGLPAPGLAVHHVNLRLSRDATDIGRWRPGKIFAVLGACVRAVIARFRHGADTLYYVPAPGKRGALYRDWAVMLLCRPFFPRLVLHWHAVGLGAWLVTRATGPERWLTRALLGRANLSIALTPSLQADAAVLTPRALVAVPNGIADPGEPLPPARLPGAPFRVLFLGALTEEKGAGILLAAIRLLGQRGVAATAVFAGEAIDPVLRRQLDVAARDGSGAVELTGFVQGDRKAALLAACDCVCLPTYYRHEGQPLVALEALAADRPLVVTAWRGLPDTVPPTVPVVAPHDPAALAEALAGVRAQPPPAGVHRAFFLAHYTAAQHLATFRLALARVGN